MCPCTTARLMTLHKAGVESCIYCELIEAILPEYLIIFCNDLMQWVMAYAREQVPPNPCSRFIKLLVLTTSAMIFRRYTQIVFQPHVKMPHLHCCNAALRLQQQHNLPVCCFWLAHSETHWLGRFFFKNTKTNNRFDLGKKRPLQGTNSRGRSSCWT